MAAPIETRIEIAASPAVVREKFLDFNSIPKYKPRFVISLGPKVPGTPLEPGVVMDNKLEGMKIQPIILENTPNMFSWRGTLPLGLFIGEHSFCFQPSEVTPGGTTFVQNENFSGFICGIIGENIFGNAIGLRAGTKAGFQGFNEDFKKWVEGGAK